MMGPRFDDDLDPWVDNADERFAFSPDELYAGLWADRLDEARRHPYDDGIRDVGPDETE